MLKCKYQYAYILDFHVDVLKDFHKVLMDNMTLKDNILDILVTRNAIDQSDSEDVMALSGRRERVRCLLLKLADHDETRFMHFIEALRQEKRPDLADVLLQKYQEYKEKGSDTTAKCNHCKIKLRVDIKDVVDKLYQERVIDEAFVNKVNRSTPSARSILWNECFFKLKRSNKRDVLSHCLKEKHGQYVTEPVAHYFKCTCLNMTLPIDPNFGYTSSPSSSFADRSESTSTSSSPFSTMKSFTSRSSDIDTISPFKQKGNFTKLLGPLRKNQYAKGGRKYRRHVQTVFNRANSPNIPEEKRQVTDMHTDSHRLVSSEESTKDTEHLENDTITTKL
jgi:hypothetical protein